MANSRKPNEPTAEALLASIAEFNNASMRHRASKPRKCDGPSCRALIAVGDRMFVKASSYYGGSAKYYYCEKCSWWKAAEHIIFGGYHVVVAPRVQALREAAADGNQVAAKILARFAHDIERQRY